MESAREPFALPTSPAVYEYVLIMLTMEEALKQSATSFAPGQIVKGIIIEVRPKEALVDIGYKSEGVVSGAEFEDIKAVKVGDEVDVLIEKLEDKDGMVILSKEKAEFKRNWDKILTICNEGGTITGKVKAAVKGGLLVNIGVEAFLPASQIDIVPPKNLAQFIGNNYEFKVVKINQDRQNIVLSRRELIEQQRNDKRAKLLTEMTPGDIRKGTVKNITDFGAFIDLNGIDGLLHITDMSWGRIGHPSEILKVGQDIDVVVLDINREKERVSLGPQAEAEQSVGEHRRQVPGRQQGQRQGRQPRALRRLRRAGAGRGRFGACHRIVLDQAHRQAVGRAQGRSGDRGRRPRHQPRGAENFPRHPPVGRQSVGSRAGEISARNQGQRQDSQPHQFTAPSSNWKKAWTA